MVTDLDCLPSSHKDSHGAASHAVQVPATTCAPDGLADQLESFDKQVASKMGRFLADLSLPTLKKLVEAGLSYDEVKRLVKIPTTWGAKIKGEQFQERVNEYFSK
jgi:hypothetical protein